MEVHHEKLEVLLNEYFLTYGLKDILNNDYYYNNVFNPIIMQNAH